MKRILPLLFCLAFVIPAATAQVPGKKSIFDYTDYGLRVGLNFQGMSSSSIKSGYNSGVMGGIYLRKYWKKIGFRIDGFVSTAHYITSKSLAKGLGVDAGWDTVRKGDFVITSLNVPFVLEYFVKKKIWLQAGVQYEMIFSSTDNTGIYHKLVKDNEILAKSGYSAVLGVDYRASRKIRLGLRYVHGLSDWNNKKFPGDNSAWTSSALQLGVSFQVYKFKGQ